MSSERQPYGDTAFPAYIYTPSGLVSDALRPGMTMRQYYKAAALQGIIAGPRNSPTGCDADYGLIAFACAQLADAMLREDEEAAK